MQALRASLLVLALALALPVQALDILVTNDDGIGSPGLQVLAAALTAAGHDVTVVAPADEQSGKGGSINTDVFGDFVPIVRVGANQYSVAGTPSDSVNAALSVLMVADPPDLVVSGLNRGQNMSKSATNASGTIGAALRAAVGFGIPAIAGSVGILFSEAGSGFPSTVAAYGPAADFIVATVAKLEARNGVDVMPRHVNVLNINFPVPATDWQGVAITRLGDQSDLQIPFFDSTLGFPPFFPPLAVAPACDAIAVGDFCLVGVGVRFPPGPDTERNADTDAHRDDFISITPMDGDMTSISRGIVSIRQALGEALP